MVNTRDIHQAPLLERIAELEAENKTAVWQVEKLSDCVNEMEMEREKQDRRFDAELEKAKRSTVYYADAHREASLELSKRVALDLRDDHWRWIGDGYDHLESMSDNMVITITASDLRKFAAGEG